MEESGMHDQYEDIKDVINHMAAVKMYMNSHKGDIEDCDNQFLMSKLYEEITELEQAIGKEDYMNVLEEAADITNFLVAIVHKHVTKYRNRK
jgi:NTP pyrophosphatase (non-canonical NTP hydrolase)